MRASGVGSCKPTHNTENADADYKHGYGQPGPLPSPSPPRQRPFAHTTSTYTTTTPTATTGSWSITVTGSTIDKPEKASAAAKTTPEDEASSPPPAAVASSTKSRNRLFDSIGQSSLTSKEAKDDENKQAMNLPTATYDISKILSKLEDLCDLVATTTAWVVDDGPRGGLRELRAGEFKQKMQALFSQCEGALGEAESAGRAACSHQGNAVAQQE